MSGVKAVRNTFAIVATIALAAGLFAPQASAAMSQDEVRSALESQYPVKVLKITEDTENDKPVYRVTMMFEGGNFNSAFQVNTIVVDAETGKPLIQYENNLGARRQAAGARTFETNRNESGSALRGHVWR